MDDSIDRRDFLSRGLRTAAGVTVLGGRSALPAACGATSTTKTSNPTASGNPGVSTATPKRGGSVTISVGSEINGFNPSTGRFDATGLMYASTVFDTLTTIDIPGNIQPLDRKS